MWFCCAQLWSFDHCGYFVWLFFLVVWGSLVNLALSSWSPNHQEILTSMKQSPLRNARALTDVVKEVSVFPVLKVMSSLLCSLFYLFCLIDDAWQFHTQTRAWTKMTHPHRGKPRSPSVFEVTLIEWCKMCDGCWTVSSQGMSLSVPG